MRTLPKTILFNILHRSAQDLSELQQTPFLAGFRLRQGISVQKTLVTNEHRAGGCGQNQALLVGRQHLGRDQGHEQEQDDVTPHLLVQQVPQVGRHTRT